MCAQIGGWWTAVVVVFTVKEKSPVEHVVRALDRLEWKEKTGKKQSLGLTRKRKSAQSHPATQRTGNEGEHEQAGGVGSMVDDRCAPRRLLAHRSRSLPPSLAAARGSCGGRTPR